MNITTFVLTLFRRFETSNSGAVATEYAFLIAFIAIVAVVGMTLLGQGLGTFFNDIAAAMANTGNAIPPLS